MRLNIIIIILIVFFLLAVSGFSLSADSSVDIENTSQESLEEAYFEGQKDALEGDIRIKKITNEKWVWKKSPWDDGRQPIFIGKED